MVAREEFQLRRQKLAQMMPSKSIAIIPAAMEKLRNGDAHYRFRQDSDFYYLTGFNEPDALLVIIAGQNSESLLFAHANDPILERWIGPRLNLRDAVQKLGVDAAFPLLDIKVRLPELIADKETIYYRFAHNALWQDRINEAWTKVKSDGRRGINAPEAFCDLAPILSELRLVKSRAELALMRQAASASVAAHKRVLSACRQAEFEYELEAHLLFELTRQGCRNVAYDSIVASGNNACILHYTANDQRIPKDGLVLMDAGGEHQNYAADISRTFPHSGRYTAEQRAIYELVLRAQQEGLSRVRPKCPWNEIQEAIIRVLCDGLVALGILKGAVDDLIETNAYRAFYMHGSGHWLGLDVHDCGAYKTDGQWRTLKPGMVLTVEPGIYISRDAKDVDERWLGIGVRIEDDIHVTENGFENLTAELPVEINEIEALICD